LYYLLYSSRANYPGKKDKICMPVMPRIQMDAIVVAIEMFNSFFIYYLSLSHMHIPKTGLLTKHQITKQGFIFFNLSHVKTLKV
jgi:hypothetical protein